jgi:hypothetical protein
MDNLMRITKVMKAIAPIYGTTNHTTTATEVDARGYSRAMWIISTGAMNATAVLEIEVQSATATGGTFADVTSAALVDATSASEGKIFIIDHPVSVTKPFLKIAGTSKTARVNVSAVCLLYNGSHKSPSNSSDVAQVIAI